MIIITAGHGAGDPGATHGVLTEAHIVTDFRNMVAFYLRRDGNHNVITDGEGSENFALSAATALIRPGSIAVEFHCNAATSPQATGVETLSGPQNKPLGGLLCAAVAGVLGIANRGAKDEGAGQHSRLAFVRAGGIILELFFLTNDADLAAYLDRKWLAARAVAAVLAAADSEALA
jgi:N-acetylmuramoyl-L-alanine amidase